MDIYLSRSRNRAGHAIQIWSENVILGRCDQVCDSVLVFIFRTRGSYKGLGKQFPNTCGTFLQSERHNERLTSKGDRKTTDRLLFMMCIHECGQTCRLVSISQPIVSVVGPGSCIRDLGSICVPLTTAGEFRRRYFTYVVTPSLKNEM